jgi:predicted outer membrane protein
VTDADRDFVREITSANLAEIQNGKLALERAEDRNVKEFAQMMVRDHTQAGEKLNALASRQSLAVGTSGDLEKNPAKALADTRGADFDRQYADTMVDAHQAMVDKLESRIDKVTLAKWKESNANPSTGKKAKADAITVVAEKSDNPVTLALNQWAAETYPVAFAHLQAARDLKKGLERRGTTP